MVGLDGESSRQVLILREAVALGGPNLLVGGRHRKRGRYEEEDVGMVVCCVIVPVVKQHFEQSRSDSLGDSFVLYRYSFRLSRHTPRMTWSVLLER